MGVEADPSRARRNALAGLATLLFAMAAHTILETTRDTLFLRDIPATRLPVAYLAMAALTWAASFLQARIADRLPRRRLLAGTLVTGAALTASFLPFTEAPRPAVLFALYVWTGVLASIVVVQLWLAVGDALDVGEAKRAFARIAAGGLVGAVAGSVAASLLLEWITARHLLPAAALLLLAAAGAALQLRVGAASTADPDDEAPRTETATPIPELLRDRYALTVLASVLLVTLLASGVDLVFKIVVAAEVPSAELGRFFARYYAVVNALALAVQLALATWLLGTLGVVRSLLLLPVLVGVGAVGIVAIGGLVPALVARAGDGVLRHSLHRAGSEILFLPLVPGARERLRSLAASVGHRGGQALASLLLLAALGLGASVGVLAAGVATCAVLLIGCLVSLRTLYVARFRDQIRALQTGDEIPVPTLDLRALETLVERLASRRDAEVLAALDLLESYDRLSLVSPLLLYHPSREVVLRCFTLLEDVRPDALREISERLLDHPEAEIRATAIRFADLGAEELRGRLDDPSDSVQVASMAQLLQRSDLDPDGQRALLEDLESGSQEARRALALALGLLPARHLEPTARRLLHLEDPRLVEAVARGLAREPDAAPLALLIELLGPRSARPHARAALLARADAPAALISALRSRETSESVRRHLPRTLSRTGSQEAIDALTSVLIDEEDPVVRHKILRGVGRMRADDPSLTVEESLVLEFAQRTLERAVGLHAARVALRARRAKVHVSAEGSDLLEALLAEKVNRALERVFRALHILDPDEAYAAAFAALRDHDALRANVRELLEHVVDPELQRGLLELVGPGTPEARLRACAGMAASVDRALAILEGEDPAENWRALLDQLERDRDPILRELVRAAGLGDTGAHGDEGDRG